MSEDSLIIKMLNAAKSARGVADQRLVTLGKLEDEGLSSREAAEVYELWEDRFLHALQSPIPSWGVLAGFRFLIDFKVIQENVKDIFPKKPLWWKEETLRDKEIEKWKKQPPEERKIIKDANEWWILYWCLLHDRDLIPSSGKLKLKDNKFKTEYLNEKWIESRRNWNEKTIAVLGGQAGNIAWVWYWMDFPKEQRSKIYTAYMSRELPTQLSAIDMEILRFSDKQAEFKLLSQATDKNEFGEDIYVLFPGSLIVAEKGYRIIYGLGNLENRAEQEYWEKIEFCYGSERLLVSKNEVNVIGNKWLRLPFFCECKIDHKTLTVRISEKEELEQAFAKINFAVLGGMDALFFKDWILPKNGEAISSPLQKIQVRLRQVVEEQLKALSECGVRIGVEISGIPDPEYARFLQRLCRKNIVVTLGINGVDELPDVTGNRNWKYDLAEFWLSPNEVSQKLRPSLEALSSSSLEYFTYLRAKKLARVMDVRTLYVHTNSLDLILRKDADPGSLLHAQKAGMMAKGWGLAALLRREYGNEWQKYIPDMLPAVQPEAMVCLAHFAKNFQDYENYPGARESLLRYGYCLAPSTTDYSLAVVPVMWPPETKAPPKDLNPTGAGDMSFGAFFRLAGA